MELIINEMPRIFKMELKGKAIELPEIGGDLSPEDVLNFYANNYPELTTAKIVGPKIDNDQVIYQFVPTLGTKG
ncbi:PRTRC system protein C [Chitinophaga sp. YIM B06452]|uniref:PRTRC system protein C n=1 Tax=Chitinophaga sp. YIM B06452 TaxID=3082158 RepID=UPI0031FE9371